MQEKIAIFAVVAGFGPERSVSSFHRKANLKTQTIRIAVDQNASGELWGRGAFGGLPAALAYVGELGDAQEGTEFLTDIPYAKNGHPEWAYWYLPRDGGDARVSSKAVGQDEFACISIEPVMNRYRCR